MIAYIIIAIIAFAAGCAVLWIAKSSESKSQKALLEAEKQKFEAERQKYEAQRSNFETRIDAERQKNEELKQQHANLLNAEKEHHAETVQKLEKLIADEKQMASQRLAEESEKSEKAIQQLKDEAESRLSQERENSAKLRNESEKQWALKLESLKEELIKTYSQQLLKNGEELRKTNDSSLNELLKPLKEQFESFKKAVDDNRTQNEVSKKSIEQKFAETLNLFQVQQANAISKLQDQTSKIGNDAVSLAKALKSNTKRQGNWGEMVLQTLLENSGLEEGVHFDVQYNVTDEEGKRNIPDVVVKFPEGRSIIIDSKVSLTAYTEYFETENEDKQEILLRNHLRSVEKHIDELSEKNYPRVVKNSMDFVMMFIPNESSYAAAIKLNPNLLHQAYAKKVIVISPNNLMMALHLAYNLWQTDKQIKNVENIVNRGKQLYEKVSKFQSTFLAIGQQIDKLQSAFSTANSLLSTGSGNVIRQCEMLTQLGVQVEKKKRLKITEEDAEALGIDAAAESAEAKALIPDNTTE